VNITNIKVDKGEKKCLKLTRKYHETPRSTANNGKSKLFKSMLIIVVVVFLIGLRVSGSVGGTIKLGTIPFEGLLLILLAVASFVAVVETTKSSFNIVLTALSLRPEDDDDCS
jgi:hypothetical protein